MEKQCKTLEKENEFHKQLVTSAGGLIQSSVSTLKYLITNFNNAPILKPLDDYSVLEDKDKFIKNIVYYHNEDKLNEYLGKFLLKEYKNKDPSKRANWTTDTARLTYVNRMLVNNNPSWIVDKKGVEMTDIMIDPFLQYIKKLAQDYINNLRYEIEEDDINDQKKKLEIMNSLNNIIKNINNETLSKEINQYLAPHLYFDNKLNLFKHIKST